MEVREEHGKHKEDGEEASWFVMEIIWVSNIVSSSKKSYEINI